MTAVLISIRSKWCELIISKKKTVEIRKSRPVLDVPFKVYVYCTVGNPTLNIPISDERLRADLLVNGMQSMNCPIGNGKVIGEFVCDLVFPVSFYASDASFFDTEPPFPVPGTCLTDKEIAEYLGNGKTGYGWHISDLKIYDEPVNLCELFEPGIDWSRITRPPQSWRYVEDQK